MPFLRFGCCCELQRDVCARIVEFAWGRSAFFPFIKLRYVHHDLTFRIQLNVRPIHGARRRTFEVNRFAVIAAAVTGTFEFVFAGLPIRRAPEVRASRIHYEQSVGSLIHPDAILLLIFRIDAERVVAGKSNFEGT